MCFAVYQRVRSPQRGRKGWEGYRASYWTTRFVLFLYRILHGHSRHRIASTHMCGGGGKSVSAGEGCVGGVHVMCVCTCECQRVCRGDTCMHTWCVYMSVCTCEYVGVHVYVRVCTCVWCDRTPQDGKSLTLRPDGVFHPTFYAQTRSVHTNANAIHLQHPFSLSPFLPSTPSFPPSPPFPTPRPHTNTPIQKRKTQIRSHPPSSHPPPFSSSLFPPSPPLLPLSLSLLHPFIHIDSRTSANVLHDAASETSELK